MKNICRISLKGAVRRGSFRVKPTFKANHLFNLSITKMAFFKSTVFVLFIAACASAQSLDTITYSECKGNKTAQSSLFTNFPKPNDSLQSLESVSCSRSAYPTALRCHASSKKELALLFKWTLFPVSIINYKHRKCFYMQIQIYKHQTKAC